MLEFNFLKALIRVVIFLPLVLLAAYFFIRLVLFPKSFTAQKGQMQVMEQLGVSGKASLVIVRVEQNYYLLGVTEQQVSILEKLDNYQPQPKEAMDMPRLKQLLSGLHKRQGEHKKW